MKFIHLSDLHIGKKLCGFSLLEDQSYILDQICGIISDVKPDGVLISGDVYDRDIPPVEGIKLFESFVKKIHNEKIPIFIISGNHDSSVRLGFGADFLAETGIYISNPYDGSVQKIQLEDQFGKLNVYLLPYVKSVEVRSILEDESLESSDLAVRKIIENMNIDESERNLLMCHLFVAGAAQCESEDIVVGTLDAVEVSAFDCFDYTALGHLHGAQNIKGNVRYCGTPLKYSFSECGHKKSVTVVELKEKGNVNIEKIPLKPLHDLKEFKGKFDDLIKPAEDVVIDDYVHIILTDEDDIADVVGKLRTVYPNFMKVDFDNKRTRNCGENATYAEIKGKSPLEIFSGFYQQQNNRELNDEQQEYIKSIIDEIWGDGNATD